MQCCGSSRRQQLYTLLKSEHDTDAAIAIKLLTSCTASGWQCRQLNLWQCVHAPMPCNRFFEDHCVCVQPLHAGGELMQCTDLCRSRCTSVSRRQRHMVMPR
jgi:hypothetical protein